MSEAKIRKRRVATINDYKTVFLSVEGRRVLYDICKSCGMFQRSYDPSQPAESVFYNEGTRAAALFILEKVKYNLEQLDSLKDEGDEYERSYSND